MSNVQYGLQQQIASRNLNHSNRWDCNVQAQVRLNLGMNHSGTGSTRFRPFAVARSIFIPNMARVEALKSSTDMALASKYWASCGGDLITYCKVRKEQGASQQTVEGPPFAEKDEATATVQD